MAALVKVYVAGPLGFSLPGQTYYDTVLLRATRDADLETPIGAFLALDDGTPAYLLESVEGGERLGRYSFLGVGPRRLLEVRNGRAYTTTRPVGASAGW